VFFIPKINLPDIMRKLWEKPVEGPSTKYLTSTSKICQAQEE
jgi:hypothetical protein